MLLRNSVGSSYSFSVGGYSLYIFFKHVVLGTGLAALHLSLVLVKGIVLKLFTYFHLWNSP